MGELAEKELATAAKVEKRKPEAVVPTKGFKAYVSTGKHTYPFDMQISGEVITGQWTAKDGLVEFLVPDHLVSGFEKHYHFAIGNIAAV